MHRAVGRITVLFPVSLDCFPNFLYFWAQFTEYEKQARQKNKPAFVHLIGSRCLHFLRSILLLPSALSGTVPDVSLYIRLFCRTSIPSRGNGGLSGRLSHPILLLFVGGSRYLDRCNRGYSQVDGLDCKPPGRTPGMVSAYSATFFMFLYSVLRRKFSSFRSHLCGNGAGSTHRIYIY